MSYVLNVSHLLRF